MSFSNVHFILFKPQLAENIGACARALKNFNFTKLKLVSPKISFPNEKVYAGKKKHQFLVLFQKKQVC